MFSLSLFSPFSCLYALHTHCSSTHTYIYTYIFTEISPHGFFFFPVRRTGSPVFLSLLLNASCRCFRVALTLRLFFFLCVCVCDYSSFLCCLFLCALVPSFIVFICQKGADAEKPKKNKLKVPFSLSFFFFFYRQASFGVNIINPDELLEKREKRCGSWSKES